MRLSSLAFILSLLVVALPKNSNAQWQIDGAPVCTGSGIQAQIQILPRENGGALFVFLDNRNGPDWDLYTESVDASGVIQSTTDGVALCTAIRNQINSRIVSDGMGGAIIVWSDTRGFGATEDVYAQRTDEFGVAQWATDGIPVCVAPGPQVHIEIVSDGAGGIIAAWSDLRNPPYNDIYAQRVDAMGTAPWTPNGVAVCTTPENATQPVITTDGAGGAIVAWTDARGGIFAQRIDASGSPLWTPDGVALCLAPGNQDSPCIVPDGAGGAIAAWEDRRNGFYTDIYAQHAGPVGTTQWTNDGVPVCTAAINQQDPTAITDGAGGIIVTWSDNRDETITEIYAQRVDASGVNAWIADGLPLCTAAYYQLNQRIVTDDAGGAIVTWQDRREGAYDFDIYAQRVNASGSMMWAAEGLPVCTADSLQSRPAIAADGSGGVLVAWEDGRNGNSDVYALRIDADGSIATTIRDTPVASALSLGAGYPNPFSDGTSLPLALALDSDVQVDVIDVAGRVVRRFDMKGMAAGQRTMEFDGRDNLGVSLPSGVYFYRVRAAGETVTRKIVIAR